LQLFTCVRGSRINYKTKNNKKNLKIEKI